MYWACAEGGRPVYATRLLVAARWVKPVKLTINGSVESSDGGSMVILTIKGNVESSSGDSCERCVRVYHLQTIDTCLVLKASRPCPIWVCCTKLPEKGNSIMPNLANCNSNGYPRACTRAGHRWFIVVQLTVRVRAPIGNYILRHSVDNTCWRLHMYQGLEDRCVPHSAFPPLFGSRGYLCSTK